MELITVEQRNRGRTETKQPSRLLMNRERVDARAERAMMHGGAWEKRDPEKALASYVEAASLAFGVLFSPPSRAEGNLPPAVKDHWVAVHRRATNRVVVLWQQLSGGMRTDRVVRMEDGALVRLQARAGDAVADPAYYDQWLSADDFKQTGLAHHFRTEGLGAPLVAIRTNHGKTRLDFHQPDEGIIHPATAILQFANGRSADGIQAATLRFYHPVTTREVRVQGERWALAADYTMPWATLLARTTALSNSRWKALFQPNQTLRPRRLYLMEPYDPDRIPIIMVHGLYSTPLAWQQMTNELMGDPEIRRRYQIWHYLYPTGWPFLSSAADFREELEKMRKLLDPGQRDFATRHMVVVGHSMGGLLTRTLITDSGDALWDSTFAIPIASIRGRPDQVAELRRMMYFQPKPYVKRVIFIAVPHRGSHLATNPITRYLAGRVRLPDHFRRMIEHLQAENPGLLKPEAAYLFRHGFPSSINVLAPSTEGLRALAQRPVAPSIPFHSIMGTRGRPGREETSDGLVPYWSSHLEGARSEKLVPSGHSAQEHQETIDEVRRILRLPAEHARK